MKEIRKTDTIELAEAFLLKHGENVVDRVGAEIDRIERNLRVKLFLSSCVIFLFFDFFSRKNIHTYDMSI